MNANLKLWDSVCKTKVSSTKKTKIGQLPITAICPQSQRKAATEVFGPYGIGWTIKNENFSFKDIGDTCLCHYSAIFCFSYDGEKGEFPINSNIKVSYITKNGSGYLKIDDDYAKKAQTDALTKGLSMLGFNSDVFEGKFDDSKYVQALQKEEEKQAEGDLFKQFFGKYTDSDLLAFLKEKTGKAPEKMSLATQKWFIGKRNTTLIADIEAWKSGDK